MIKSFENSSFELRCKFKFRNRIFTRTDTEKREGWNKHGDLEGRKGFVNEISGRVEYYCLPKSSLWGLFASSRTTQVKLFCSVSPRCRSELNESAWVAVVLGQKCIKKNFLYKTFPNVTSVMKSCFLHAVNKLRKLAFSSFKLYNNKNLTEDEHRAFLQLV